MNAKDAIRMQAEMSRFVLKTYLDDLSDADLLTRPAKGCNHLAWQLGHLVASEAMLLNSICPGAAAPLPDGVAEAHSKETCGSDDPAKFLTKQRYFELLDQQHAATQAALEKFAEEDLDKPGPENFRRRFPTVGSIWLLLASHPLMHAGQFAAVRRQLGKPVVI